MKLSAYSIPGVARPKIPTIEKIIEHTFKHYGLPSREAMISKSRRKEVVWPRQIAIALARELTGRGVQEIGLAFRKDHATVTYAESRVRFEAKTYKTFQEDYNNLKNKILYGNEN